MVSRWFEIADRSRSIRRNLADTVIDNCLYAAPYFIRILLHPSWMRKGYLYWHGGSRKNFSFAINYDRLGVGRALINC